MTDIEMDNWCELHSEFHGNCLEELTEARTQSIKVEDMKCMLEGLNNFMDKFGLCFASKKERAIPFHKNVDEIFKTLTHAVHTNAVEHGWWEEDRGTEPLLLMHTEISEAVEALREGNPESKKIPGHSHVAEELADVVIRVLDYCGKNDINIGAAITAKHEFNRSRPYRHGGKVF